jgi:hypothetical protein
MLLLRDLLGAAAAALTATLTFTSARNVLQTYACSMSSSPPLLVEPSSVAEMVQHLQNCKRKELLQIYLHGTQTPTLSNIQGECWDAMLLENNGIVMVRTSQTKDLLQAEIMYYR